MTRSKICNDNKVHLENKNDKAINLYHNLKPITIRFNKIYAIEVFDHNLNIITSKSIITIRDQLSRHIEELQENGFIEIRRGIAVNSTYIDKIDDSKVYLTNGKIFYISKKKLKTVKQQWSNLFYY